MPLQSGHEKMPDPSKLVERAIEDVEDRIAKGKRIAKVLSGDTSVPPGYFDDSDKAIQPPIHSEMRSDEAEEYNV